MTRRRASLGDWWRTLVVGLLVLSIGTTSVASGRFFPELPALDRVTDYQPRQPLQVYTRDGVEIAQFGSERRQFVPIEQIPPMMQEAVIAVEDARFRQHVGIDLWGILRAIVAALTGGRRQGASTITQQVARNFYLTQERTLERKLKEAALALRIERTLSKDRILELYMNQIYLGQRAYGFAAASQVYFGKPMAQLSIAETAVLAGLPQNPVYANPTTNVDRAIQRQRIVLVRMRDTGVITAAQYTAAVNEKLTVRSRLDVEVHAEHVAEMARQAVFERYGDRAYTEGFRVYTSLVAADQQVAWNAVRRRLLEYDRRQPWRGPEGYETLADDVQAGSAQAAVVLKEYRDDEDLRLGLVLQAGPSAVTVQLATGELVPLDAASRTWAKAALQPGAQRPLALVRGAVIRVLQTRGGWTLTQWPQVQGAFVSMEPSSGRIRSMVGGFDFTRQQFNHVTQAWRQPGSTLKPFLYSAALERAVMPSTLIYDGPIDGLGDWTPQNSDGRYDGPLTLRQALARSKNMVSIRLTQYVGVQDARQWVGRFGFDVERQPANLTLALGAGSATPLQMVSAYSMLANGGFRVTPTVIERIVDAKGQTVWQAPPPPALSEDLRAVPDRNVFIVNTLLQEVTRSGTAAKAQAMLKRPDLYGKTGTTNDAVDAWFAGFQPGVAAVAWIGYDEPRSLGARESGGGLALPLWIDYMGRALSGVPVAHLNPPGGLTQTTEGWSYVELAGGAAVYGLGLPAVDGSAPAADAPMWPSSASQAPVTYGPPVVDH